MSDGVYEGKILPPLINSKKGGSGEGSRLTRNLSRLISEHETSDGGDGAEEDRDSGDFLLARSGTVVEVSAIGSVASHPVRSSCIVCLSARDFKSPHLGHGHHLLLRSRIFEIGLLEDG